MQQSCYWTVNGAVTSYLHTTELCCVCTYVSAYFHSASSTVHSKFIALPPRNECPFDVCLEGPRFIRSSWEREVDPGAVLHPAVRDVEPHGVCELGLRAELVERGEDVRRQLHGGLKAEGGGEFDSIETSESLKGLS